MWWNLQQWIVYCMYYSIPWYDLSLNMAGCQNVQRNNLCISPSLILCVFSIYVNDYHIHFCGRFYKKRIKNFTDCLFQTGDFCFKFSYCNQITNSDAMARNYEFVAILWQWNDKQNLLKRLSLGPNGLSKNQAPCHSGCNLKSCRICSWPDLNAVLPSRLEDGVFFCCVFRDGDRRIEIKKFYRPSVAWEERRVLLMQKVTSKGQKFRLFFDFFLYGEKIRSFWRRSFWPLAQKIAKIS